MKKPTSLIITPKGREPFIVRTGDKIVLASSRRSTLYRQEPYPTPDYRRVELILDIMGGKFPRARLKGGNTLNLDGSTGFGSYRAEPYDEANEARLKIIEENHIAMVQAVSRIRRMTEEDWQHLCFDKDRREAVLTLIEAPTSPSAPGVGRSDPA